MSREHSLPGRIVEAFLRGNLSVLLIILSLTAGTVALLLTPREEEPQIVVPLADVIVQYPGGSAEEVEKLVSSRLERLLYQIDGVEYVYSISRPGQAVVTVRFYVGEDREESLLKLYNKIHSNLDRETPGIAGWIVKPIEIDDVPIVNATLYSDRHDEADLYRVAEEVVSKLQHVKNSADIRIFGGRKRTVQVYLHPERLAAYGMSAPEIARALQVSNVRLEAGSFERANEQIVVSAGPFLQRVEEVRDLMIGVHAGRSVYLRDVAEIVDGPEEVATYSRIGFGPAGEAAGGGGTFPAVTISVAKKKGSNAVWVARDVARMLDQLRGPVIPDEVHVRITRDYGRTANEKVNDLVQSLGLAIVTVIGLLALTMSWREGLVVALAVPITYSLTLICNLLLGFTINRVTLFALILALGLLVDDPIVGVENIHRHLRHKSGDRFLIITLAMAEVMSPIILSTLAVIVSFTPMFFITGMMGPYMGPMALNVPITVVMSTVVALTITPWLANALLRTGNDPDAPFDISRTLMYRIYGATLRPLLDRRGLGRAVLAVTAVLFVISVALALTGWVPLKMLPFDNKDEFQLLVDLPETATLEATDRVVRELEEYLDTIPEVTEYVSSVGMASPMDFNGLVRHYYLRHGPHLADLRVNLLPRRQRRMSSHALGLRVRNDLAALAERTGASIKLIEVPPGPPVLSTLVAEVYGQPHHTYDELVAAAGIVKARMAREPGVVDLDDTVEAAQTELTFTVDREKAGLNGISTEDIAGTLRLALSGLPAGTVHAPSEQNELPIRLRIPRGRRSEVAQLLTLPVKGNRGGLVQLGELVSVRDGVRDLSIHHKNQERVVYVTAEMAGRGPAYAVLALGRHFRQHPLPDGITLDWRGEGEWKITVDVFRDLGLAFSAALLGIYVLLVYETASFLLPVVIMLSIPLTLIGIMPGFWLLNAVGAQPVGGFDNPIFFTATAMIGMIALSGIVIRNAIILIDFIQTAVNDGMDLREAIIQSGAVRFRPIFLTACTTVLGAWPITLDPIFSGLAWAIIFGMFVSTAFTLIIIPIVYLLLYGRAAAAD